LICSSGYSAELEGSRVFSGGNNRLVPELRVERILNKTVKRRHFCDFSRWNQAGKPELLESMFGSGVNSGP
jgi:hypothetical protein